MTSERPAAPVVHHRDEYETGDRNPTSDIFVAERPWGSFTQFVSNETVTVKTITVEAGTPPEPAAARTPGRDVDSPRRADHGHRR
jgi:hypothetical protein